MTQSSGSVLGAAGLILTPALLFTIVACGSSTGPAPKGSLVVSVSGAQQGSTVTVLGPSGFDTTFSSTTALTKLTPGSYTVLTDTTQVIPDSIVGFHAIVGAVNGGGVRQTVTVVGGDTARATVAFGMHRFGGLIVNADDSNEVLEIAPGQLTASGNVVPASDIQGTVIQPAASALDAHGNLWVVSYTPGNQIAMFTAAQRAAANGPVTPTVTIGNLPHPWGIAIGSNGTVWVADQLNNTIVGYTADQVQTSGNPTPSIVLSTSPADTAWLNSPSGLAFDAAGNLWVANNAGSIDEIPKSQLQASGTMNPVVIDTNRTIQPSRLAFDSAGNLWVSGFNAPGFIVEYAKGDLATNGALPTVVLSMTALGPNPRMWGVAFDNRGYLWTSRTSSLTAYAFSPAQLAASGSPTPAITLDITSAAHGTGTLGVLLDPYVLLPGN